MRLVVEHVLPTSPSTVFEVVGDLGRYPSWMGLVHAVRPLGVDTWDVQLRARIGPLARSKRLTMTRVIHDAPRHVRFERRENDGRSHGSWILDVTVEPVGAESGRSRLVMELQYGGRLWTSVVEKVLHDEIEASKARLERLVAP